MCLKLYFGFLGIDFESFVSKDFEDEGNGFESSSSSLLLNSDGTCSCWVSVTVSLHVGCCSVTVSLCVGCCSVTVSLCVGCCSSEVDALRAVVLSLGVRLFLCTFFPGSYFLLLVARWSFFSATAKSLATCSCGYLELKSSFLIKKCAAAAAKYLVGSLKETLENFGWNGCGSIKLHQYSSIVSSWVSLSFSNLSSVGAHKCGGIFNWMMGLTASFNTKVNCSGKDTLLNCTTAAATCDMWLCESCR